MKKDLGIKILFIVILLFSIYLIISGLTSKDSPLNSDILEEDLLISEGDITLDVGEQKQITATIIPNDATYKSIIWESVNPSIATVNNGLITGINSGNTVIKVVTEKRQITKIINVTVKIKEIPVTEIKVENQNIELEVGDTRKIEYEILPEDATNKNINISTSDKNIVSFTQDREIIGVSEGNTTIILKANNDISTTINVNVKKKTIPVTGVSLNKSSLTLTLGKSDTLIATVKPSNATNTNVIWESSNNEIVSVDNGKITGVKVGSATITVKTLDGNKTATCDVTIKNNKASPIVPPNPIQKYESSTLKYYVTNHSGYYLTYIWMDDPYHQIRKLDANVAQYGKVLKDSEFNGNYTLRRKTVGEMMNSYIAHNIIPVNKGAVGFNASGFYVKGAWNPPSDYYNNRSSSWLVITDGIITRNNQTDGQANNIMIGIDYNGDLKIYDYAKTKAERETRYNEIINDKVLNTWDFHPTLVLDGKAVDTGNKESARRQGICQVNSNNYIMLTTVYNFNYEQMSDLFIKQGCKTAFNLDGGGSTSLFVKKAGTKVATKIKCSDGSSREQCRSIVEGIYFGEK